MFFSEHRGQRIIEVLGLLLVLSLFSSLLLGQCVVTRIVQATHRHHMVVRCDYAWAYWECTECHKQTDDWQYRDNYPALVETYQDLPTNKCPAGIEGTENAQRMKDTALSYGGSDAIMYRGPWQDEDAKARYDIEYPKKYKKVCHEVVGEKEPFCEFEEIWPRAKAK
jgi:hypothetical protein